VSPRVGYEGKLQCFEAVLTKIEEFSRLDAIRTSPIQRAAFGTIAKCELPSYSFGMVITMSAKGQFVIPKIVRERLKLMPGCKASVTIDAKNRLVLTPALLEPSALFASRPPVTRVVTLEEMDAAIAKGSLGSI
jgi:bifunctional DNA-binding transcriptional regulator/antitoxin component of YhaV-PrlF toxin-antitoxin module